MWNMLNKIISLNTDPTPTPVPPPAGDPSVQSQVLKVLECPVCYELCKRPVLQCSNGHIVCNKCRIKLNICPLCKEHNFKSHRNLVAEEIGALLLDPEPEAPPISEPACVPNPASRSSSGVSSSSLSGRPRQANSNRSDTSGSNISLAPYNFRSRRVPAGFQRYNFRPGRVFNNRSSVRARSSGYNTRANRILRGAISRPSRNPLDHMRTAAMTIVFTSSNHNVRAQFEADLMEVETPSGVFTVEDMERNFVNADWSDSDDDIIFH